ncbi:ArsR/SmtB family transcription factor [Paludifilum halophilum]|uniref:Transcriptional regulator n=1 Tax=Paludifilum halophilum TaxID=1642702 RepID=A0A235B3H9_9BACL|nr:metalloregulator ArsR/SmtB family transcription factor [Paludifilum halophilum]OYD06866.1 transcriptional regulator [Paludifilum halophilum]
MSEDRCDIYCYDEEKVRRVQSSLKTEDFMGTAQLFKALADPTRMKIAYALIQEKELCVCDVANIIRSSLATASHHLRLLRNMGLARYRKEGKLVFYSLDDDHVKQLVQLAFDHHKEMKPVGTSE